MKFKHIGIHSSGHIADNATEPIDTSAYGVECEFSTEIREEFSPIKENQLEVKWFVSILQNTGGIVYFETRDVFDITEREIEPTDEDLTTVINPTYKRLKQDFIDKKGFNPLREELSSITMQKLLGDARQALLSQPKS